MVFLNHAATESAGFHFKGADFAAKAPSNAKLRVYMSQRRAIETNDRKFQGNTGNNRTHSVPW